jgi:predicted O-methyltransferase YrrM
MIVDERTITYINSLENGDSPFVRAVAKAARDSFVPIIRKETASLLKTLVELGRPQRILEVGTAVGYSALLMAEHMPEGCQITTIEKYEKRIPIARENFRQAGMEDRITLLEGDAAEVLKELEGPYDLIFMDAAKGQYIHFLPEVMRLLAVGGMLISDNCLQDGDLIESRFAVTRRNRTIHARMRAYLYELKHRDDLQTAIIPIGDGVTVSVKRGEMNAGEGRQE